MAWETRGSSRYYYQSERDEDGRVKKRYIGTGEIAELVAHADETRRRARPGAASAGARGAGATKDR